MWRHPPLADGWIDSPHLRFDLGDLPLESGKCCATPSSRT